MARSDRDREREQMLKSLRQLHARYEKATAALQAIEDERAELYLAARSMDPPMTFRAIANVFGVTEAAVMQKLRRAAAADPGATVLPMKASK